MIAKREDRKEKGETRMAENEESIYDDSTKTLDFTKIAEILAFSTTLKELSYNSDIIIDGRKYDLQLKITPRKDEKHDK